MECHDDVPDLAILQLNVPDEQNNRVYQLEVIQNEAKELFRKKNADYGDAFATYGTVGILVRLGDKIHRLQSITSKGINLVQDEKLRDTLLDLHNYAAMGIMLLDNGVDITSTYTATSAYSSNNSHEPSSLPEPSVEAPSNILRKLNWQIQSTTNEYIYNRETIIYTNGKKVDTCSCGAFKYCTKANKTCKHIENEDEYDDID